MWAGFRRINNGSTSFQSGFGGIVQGVNALKDDHTGLETWSADSAYHIEWRSTAAVGERAHFSLRATEASTLEAKAIYSEAREDQYTGWSYQDGALTAVDESPVMASWTVMELVINRHDGRGWFRVLDGADVKYSYFFDVLFRPPGIVYSCSPALLGVEFDSSTRTPWVLDSTSVRSQEVDGSPVFVTFANPAGYPYPSTTAPGNQAQQLVVPEGWAAVDCMGGLFGQATLRGALHGNWTPGDLIEDRADVEIRAVLLTDALSGGCKALPWPKPAAWSEYTYPSKP